MAERLRVPKCFGGSAVAAACLRLFISDNDVGFVAADQHACRKMSAPSAVRM